MLCFVQAPPVMSGVAHSDRFLSYCVNVSVSTALVQVIHSVTTLLVTNFHHAF